MYRGKNVASQSSGGSDTTTGMDLDKVFVRSICSPYLVEPGTRVNHAEGTSAGQGVQVTVFLSARWPLGCASVLRSQERDDRCCCTMPRSCGLHDPDVTQNMPQHGPPHSCARHHWPTHRWQWPILKIPVCPTNRLQSCLTPYTPMVLPLRYCHPCSALKKTSRTPKGSEQIPLTEIPCHRSTWARKPLSRQVLWRTHEKYFCFCFYINAPHFTNMERNGPMRNCHANLICVAYHWHCFRFWFHYT